MDTTCRDLDETVLELFQVLEDLYVQQDKLEQIMKDGYLGISRARYLLGVKWISADQILDVDMVAKYTTRIEESLLAADEESGSPGNVGQVSQPLSWPVVELCEAMAEVSIDQVEDKKSAPSSEASSSLRQRHKEKDGAEDSPLTVDSDSQQLIDKSPDVRDTSNTGSKRSSSRGSLSLFGLLPPQPLRTSHKCFEAAVQMAVSVADLKVRLHLLQRRYKQLLQKKHLAEKTEPL